MLDDGVCFEGEARGAAGETAGEVVFTTSMAGDQDTLTDPSYSGQIVAFTAAHLGNYGASSLDDESPRPCAAGAVFHDLFSAAENISFPHWRAEESLNAKLIRHGITAIAGVDTRALTLHLRERGARGGVISALDLDRPALLRRARAIPPMQGQDLAGKVSCRQAYEFSPQPDEPSLRVALIDYGVKRSIALKLTRLGLAVSVWPAATSASDILASRPDGVLLPNGPGDPEPCVYAVKTIRGLLGRVPLFGICLGHQLLGLALGGRTYKLPFGHHGVNHPVLDLATRRVLITSQNHGFCVDPDSLPVRAEPSHWNLNDDTLEGLAVKDAPAFSVQFHPEAVPGPTEAGDLFTRFRDLILQTK
jgi:carbamoyl-phosphate synthase small subunit